MLRGRRCESPRLVRRRLGHDTEGSTDTGRSLSFFASLRQWRVSTGDDKPGPGSERED